MSHLCFFWHGLRRHQPMKSPHIVAGYIAQCLCVLCDNLLLNIQPARQRIIATQTVLTHFAGVICVCHSTTLVRWPISWQHHSAGDWLSAMRHPCLSLHAQHVPWSNCLLQLCRSQTSHWYLFIKPVNFSNSKLFLGQALAHEQLCYSAI